MALPVGVLIAIYVSEFADQRVARVIKLTLDVLNGLPSIVIGIFLFVLLVVGRGQNGFIGALALAIIMLPLISRTDPGGARARAATTCAREASRSGSASGGRSSA